MMRIFIVISFSVVLLCSCHKERDRINGNEKYLNGKWEWRETFYYEDNCTGNSSLGYFLNPIPLDAKFYIEFDRKGVVKYYKNSTIVQEYNVKFSSTTIEGEITTTELYFNGSEELPATVSWDGSFLTYSDYPFVAIDCHILGNEFSKVP